MSAPGKGPLGVMPRWAWESQCNLTRIDELSAAILRFVEADKEFPPEWVEELRRLKSTESQRPR